MSDTPNNQSAPAQLLVTASPHVRDHSSTRKIMLDVIIALLPAVAVSIYYFGKHAVAVYAVTLIATVFTEWFSRKFIFK